MCLQFAHPRQQGGRRFSMTQRIELKIGNVLDKLKRIESDSVDCIVTSCPYYGLRKYKAPDVAWGDWKGQLGLEPDYRMYLNHMLKITAELKRVLKPTGTLWWNMGDSYGGKQGRKSGWRDPKANSHRDFDILPQVGQEKSLMQLPTRLSIRMADEQGWLLRNTLIWHKRNHMPSSVKDRLANSYEYVFFFTKQKRYFFNLDAVRVPNKVVGVTDMRPPGILRQKSYQNSSYNKSDDPHLAQFQKPHSGYFNYDGQPRFNPLGKNPGDVLELSTMPFKGAHFAVFPPKLPEFCIKAGSPEEVCSACGKPKVNIIKEGNLISSSPTIPMAIKPRANKINRLKIQDLPKDPWGSLPKREREITGTKPTCTCNAPFEPGVVLDPFAGSGTTMMVARQLGRSAIGIELSEEYAKMIKQRLGWGCGLDIEWKED